jgi:hypothetical protein
MKKTFSFEYDLTEEYQTIAISSHLKDYRLCWNLNHILKADLQKVADLEFSSKKSALEKYSFYYYYNPDQRCFYYLLSNKKNHSMILEKMTGVDYILLIKGFLQNKELNRIIKDLKNTQNILTAYLIDMSHIQKEMNFFLTDLELHYINVLRDSNKHLLIQH